VTGFATVVDATAPVRIVLVGAGAMGRNWIRVLSASPDVELVGLVDLDVELARSVVAELGLVGVVVGASLTEVAAEAKATAVVNVTVPVAHYSVNTEAMFGGLPVLCEKPIAPTVSQALALAAAAEASGQLLMTSQSRRYYRALAELRGSLSSVGQLGIVTTEFYRDPHFGGFRDEMDQPLLVDMAIHAFDVARYLLDANPTSVYCETFNPQWSWYRGDAAAFATFEFEGGIRFLFNGSWCSGGQQTSWNGSWRLSGSEGTASWDGESAPVIQSAGGATLAPEAVSDFGGEEIAGSLAEFIHAIRTGETPSGAVHSNVHSLAMVEAAVRSAETGTRIVIGELLEDAYATALETETRADIHSVLDGWGSARAGLSAGSIEPISR
jgi:predicted dehydrogenase